jgi:hypothetical protein
MMQDPNGDGMETMPHDDRWALASGPVDASEPSLLNHAVTHSGALRYGNPLWTVSFSLESMVFVCNTY